MGSGFMPLACPGMTDQTMPTYKLLLLPGDGIGPEVIGEVQKLIAWFRKSGIATF